MSLDALILTPLQPISGNVLDPQFRMTTGGHLWVPLLRAVQEVETEIGRPLAFGNPDTGPSFGAGGFQAPHHRSAASVVLATHLESAGLRWHAIDPGPKELAYWREKLQAFAASSQDPKVVAISTTFITAFEWIGNLVALVRTYLPTSKIVIGGYAYASNPKEFLSIAGDVLVIGEGEVRFPEIVRRVREGRSLDDIKGLYIRKPDGKLAFTGRPEPLRLEDIGPANWKLSARMDPAIDVTKEPIEYNIETQRGCVFKCEFCTYRTIAALEVMAPEPSVEVFFNTAGNRGNIILIDATGTYPRPRWEQILEMLIERGGSPLPIGHFARVSDITERTAQLMATAGVKQVLIGQESGDQRILNAMKKGTNVQQVKPAIQALGRAGLEVFMSFIHGFPGEDEQSCENTRSMIAKVNEGFERPVVMFYKVDPLGFFQLSSLKEREELATVEHWLDYDYRGLTAKQAADHAVETFIRISRIPYAPVNYNVLVLAGAPATGAVYVAASPHKFALHRWLKSVERMTAAFIDRDLRGTPVNRREIARLRKQILEAYPRSQSSVIQTTISRARARVMGRLVDEWSAEQEAGPGLLTRLACTGRTLGDFRDRALARQAFDRAALPARGRAPADDVLSDELIHDSLEEAKSSNKRLKVLNERMSAQEAKHAPLAEAAAPV
jgi:anaerobic magnesium-protoporphyrin IX monomethyl ester cyclase